MSIITRCARPRSPVVARREPSTREAELKRALADTLDACRINQAELARVRRERDMIERALMTMRRERDPYCKMLFGSLLAAAAGIQAAQNFPSILAARTRNDECGWRHSRYPTRHQAIVGVVDPGNVACGARLAGWPACADERISSDLGSAAPASTFPLDSLIILVYARPRSTVSFVQRTGDPCETRLKSSANSPLND